MRLVPPPNPYGTVDTSDEPPRRYRIARSSWFRLPFISRPIPLSVSVEVNGRGYNFSLRREARP